MGFFTSRSNMRSAQPNRRLVPPPRMNRPIPKPQMSRSIQPIRPPTGLPQQMNAPTGLPNVNQPPLGLPNEMQQPTGLPPTQTQMPTPPAVPPVEQSSSLFAPPPQMQQPAIDPVFQQPQQMQQQMQQPVAPEQMQEQAQPVDKPGDIYGGLTPGQALGGEFTMQQPDKNQYVSIDGGRPANPMSQIPMMGKGQYDAMQQPVAGPIDPSFAKVGFGRFQDEYGNWIT